MKIRFPKSPLVSLRETRPGLAPSSDFQVPKLYEVWPIAYLVSAAVYLAFVAHQPVQIIGESSHDDALFWTHAENMLSGNWLGEYSQMTLPKGVGFPVLIALGAILSIPVHVVAAIVLIGCLAILLSTLRILDIPELVLFSIFIATISQSSLIMERPLRENLYSSLTLAVVALAIRLVADRNEKSTKRIFLIGVVVGVLLVTREESIWVLPGLIFILLGAWIFVRRPKISPKLIYKPISSALLGILLAPLIVGFLNFIYYGTLNTEDFTQGNFPKVVSVLQSVTENTTLRRVPVTRENREAIYAVSKSFNELRPYFEGPGMRWTEYGCRYFNDLCGEYGPGWFSWALRDAVASNGYYSSPREAEAFYGRLFKEVETACNLGKLECKGGGFWIVPEITDEMVHELFPTILQGFSILTLEQFQPEVLGRSTEGTKAVPLIRAILGSPQIMPLTGDDYGLVKGWQLGPKEDRGSFGVKCHAVDSVQPGVSWLPSPDLVKVFGDEYAGQSRFQFSYPEDGDCRLILGDLDSPATLSVTELTAGSNSESGGFLVHIDYIRESQVDEPFEVALMLKNKLSDLNSKTNPLFLWGAALALMLAIVSTIIRRSRYLGVYLIVAGIYVLVLSRIALLAIISVSSFPAMSAQYALPAFALVSLAGILSFYGLIREIRYWASKLLPRINLIRSTGAYFWKQQPDNPRIKN